MSFKSSQLAKKQITALVSYKNLEARPELWKLIVHGKNQEFVRQRCELVFKRNTCPFRLTVAQISYGLAYFAKVSISIAVLVFPCHIRTVGGGSFLRTWLLWWSRRQVRLLFFPRYAIRYFLSTDALQVLNCAASEGEIFIWSRDNGLLLHTIQPDDEEHVGPIIRALAHII
jgi:hypothetical protein